MRKGGAPAASPFSISFCVVLDIFCSSLSYWTQCSKKGSVYQWRLNRYGVDVLGVIMKSFRFLAMKRSGHHAVMNWVLSSCPNSKFLNNVESSSNKQFMMSLDMSQFLVDAEWFLYNIEDYDPFKTYSVLKEHPSKDVLVLRDLKNCMASRLATTGVVKAGMLELWKKHAKMYLDDDLDMIKINFNNWFKSCAYRNWIASLIGFENHDCGLKDVPNYGNGSSFDGLKYNGKGNEMDVLNRYKMVQIEPYIDDESLELNDKIFYNIKMML